MKLQILDKTKKRKFIDEISYLGIEKIPYLLIRSGKEKIRAFSGSLSNEEVMTLYNALRIEGVGLYFGKQMINRHGQKESRLSLDALHVLKGQIKKNVIKLTKQQEKDWFKGKDVELEDEKMTEYVAVMSSEDDDFIGVGKVSHGGEILMGFLAKERRVKGG